MSDVISYRPLAGKARFEFQATPCWYYGGQSLRKIFLQILRFFPFQYHSTSVFISLELWALSTLSYSKQDISGPESVRIFSEKW